MTRAAEQAAEALRNASALLQPSNRTEHDVQRVQAELGRALAALTAEAGGATTEKGDDPNKGRNRATQEAPTPGRDKSAPALGSGPERAKAALRMLQGLTVVSISDEAKHWLGEALDALAAPVPPDREALAREAQEWSERYSYGSDPNSRDVSICLEKAAALLRAPAQAEVEAMAKRLEALCPDSPTAQDAAALLRRLSLSPAVGEIKPRKLDGTGWKHRCCQVADAARQEGFDYALSLQRASPAVGAGWRPTETESIADLQAELARVQSTMARRVLGDPTIGVGSQPLPLPPAPEEAKS